MIDASKREIQSHYDFIVVGVHLMAVVIAGDGGFGAGHGGVDSATGCGLDRLPGVVVHPAPPPWLPVALSAFGDGLQSGVTR